MGHHASQMGGLTESMSSRRTIILTRCEPFPTKQQGIEGAFVVATNASWHRLANPANCPVWCGYYDDLGSVGILNCGPRPTRNTTSTLRGTCPRAALSYMVAVTATNNDVRTFSGYGATTIDLGAPGESVFLPSGSSGYGNTSGTSFASPCVAGAIALVYSAPCPDLMELALGNPQGAADLVRATFWTGRMKSAT